MHGCGIKFIPDDSEIMQQAGQFIDDEYIGPSDVCSVAAAQRAAQQALTAARLASGLQVCCRHLYLPLKVLFCTPAQQMSCCSDAHVMFYVGEGRC